MNLAVKSYKRAGLMIISVSLAFSMFALPVMSEDATIDTKTTSVESQKQRVETQTKEREARCKRRQVATEKRANGIYQYNSKAISHLDAVLGRVEEFVDKQNLQVENYAGLLNRAKSSQADAASALSAIKTAPLLNCTRSDNRSDIDAYKEKVGELTNVLKEYRANLRKLIKDVKSAARPAEIVR